MTIIKKSYHRQLINKSKKYRLELSNKHMLLAGLVSFFNNEICGWSSELINPEHWEPGVYQIDLDNNIYITTGGSSYDGATAWEKVSIENDESNLCNEQSKKINSSFENVTQDDEKIDCWDCVVSETYDEPHHTCLICEQNNYCFFKSINSKEHKEKQGSEVHVKSQKKLTSSCGLSSSFPYPKYLAKPIQLYFHQFILKTPIAEGQK